KSRPPILRATPGRRRGAERTRRGEAPSAAKAAFAASPPGKTRSDEPGPRLAQPLQLGVVNREARASPRATVHESGLPLPFPTTPRGASHGFAVADRAAHSADRRDALLGLQPQLGLRAQRPPRPAARRADRAPAVPGRALERLGVRPPRGAVTFFV